jgi:lysophospholipase L1-like esterase
MPEIGQFARKMQETARKMQADFGGNRYFWYFCPANPSFMRHLFVYVFLLLSVPLPAQVAPVSLIDPAENYISQSQRGLLHFYERLLALESSRIRTVNIVHIGDSHVQADWLTGQLRQDLQQRFGNAGRGLVFPFRLAGTNSPGDIVCSSASSWEATRLISMPTAVGISGFRLRTYNPNFQLQIGLRGDVYPSDVSFDQVKVLFDTDPRTPALTVNPSLPGYPPGRYVSGRTWGQVWSFDTPVSAITLTGVPHDESTLPTSLYGVSFENTRSSGILYHAIGVNGAQFSHYTAASNLMVQIRALQPDLIILSLGANDTHVNTFNTDAFFREIDRLVAMIEESLPFTDILLTTPGDAWRVRRYRNPHVATWAGIINSYAQNRDIACWDFYRIMGGDGSIQRWYLAGMAQPDRLHLTRQGYEYEAKMLYQALVSSYEQYKNGR